MENYALNKLPHQYPLLLIDRVTYLEVAKIIKAKKNITFNDKFFEGHFPQNPIYPGALIIEGLCQCAQLLHGSKLAVTAKLESFKFTRPVFPGDVLEYEVSFDSLLGPFVISKAKAKIQEKTVASGTIIGQEIKESN